MRRFILALTTAIVAATAFSGCYVDSYHHHDGYYHHYHHDHYWR